MRGEGLLKKVIKGRIQWKIHRERKRQKLLDVLKSGQSFQKAKERALNREY